MNQQGMTLVEVVVSILIITIISVSILTFFIQAARTNKVSENIADATYTAQTYMEEIYELSTLYDLDHGISELQKMDSSLYPYRGFTIISSNNNLYEFEKVTDSGLIRVQISEDNNLSSLIIKVYESPEKLKLEAQMETYLKWKE